MAISQMLHVALVVTDLARSQHFYQHILGLAPAERSLSFPGLWFQIGAQQLHLIRADHWRRDQVNADKWGRNRHVAFGTSNLGQMRQRLEAFHHPIQISASGRAALFTQDPDGNIIELSEISNSLTQPLQADCLH